MHQPDKCHDRSVTYIGFTVFGGCINLNGVYFQGNAPSVGLYVFENTVPIIYYLPGTAGWESRLGPTARLPTR
ncbi:MAG: hypothetical protein IPK15_13935 [Verrucomicrobia bacterium]|nr:hypothetical protein [Verrucomicrobiota bacterium]